MAILKDLIVHGSSRFLNKIYAEELETSAFEAESAIIKKLIAKDATMENATVVGLLDVQGQLHTNTWTNSNIATIDGCFYITPTLSSDTGSIVFTSTSTASLTGTYTAVTSLYIGDSTSGSTVQWTKDSNVLLTGEVKVNGQWLPLGTLLGTLSANATTSSIGLTGLTDNRHNTSSIITDIRNAVSNTSLDYRNLKISLYQRKDGTDSKPLGIYMTAMGTNGKTFIDIYGGVNSTTTAGSSGGFADPNLRIGNLSGLNAVEGTTPQGWGIYTTNGYFKGVIVSSAGKIGGWSIGTSGIYNGITGVTTTGSTAGTFIGTGGISNYKDTSTYVNIQNGVITAKGVNLTGQITATSGTIGGASIVNGTLTVPAANVSGELTAATINGSKITANTITASQIATNAITADELAANAVTSAKIKAGEVKADNIAADAVTAAKISVDNLSAISASMGTLTSGTISYGTVGSDSSFYLSSSDTSVTIAGASRTGLRLTVGSNFGVSNTGILYASSAIISGAITATSLSTGTKTASTTGKGTYIDGNGNIYVGNGSTNNFTVTDTGTITATGANLLTATIGNATNKITIGTGTSGHSSIRYGMTTWADTTNNGFYIGTDGIALGKGAFKVTAAGALTATSGSISGGIVTSGIDAGNITAGTLSADRIGANSIDASKINVSSISIGNLSGVSNYAQKTDVTQAIDNIEVGGRNLLKYDVKDYGIAASKISARSNCRGMYFACEGNQTYTISRKQVEGNKFWIATTTEEPVDGLNCDTIFDEDNSILKYTFTTSSTARYVFIYLSNESDVINNGNIKAEKGNKATDWTPAPEDIEDNIEEAEKVATSYITQINDTGIKITPYDKSNNNYLQLDANTISMYRANIETLRIDDNNIRIGKENYQNLLLKSNEILLKTGNKQSLKINPKELSYFFKNGNSPFYIKQLEKPQTATGDGSKKQFVSNTSYFIQQLYGISINGIEQKENEDYTYSISNGICTVDFVSAPANNATIIFDYDIEYEIAQLLKTASDADPSARKYIGLPQTCMEVLHVYVNNTETSAWHYPSFSVQGETITTYDYIRLDSDPGQGASIKVLYKKQAGTGFYMTLGTRDIGSNDPGPYSLTVGKECMAEGQCSFAGGKNTAALGKYSFAYGDGGNSDSDCVEVNADFAGAIGKGLRINRTGGFACGTYNTYSPNYTWAFQVGNGTSAMDRSDAFGVASNGNIYTTGILMSGVVGKNPSPIALFTTQVFSVDNIVVPATGGSVAATSDLQQINIGISGYIAIGLMSFLSQTATNNGVNASCVFPYVWWINQGYFRFRLRNTVASQVKTKITFRILYIAASAVQSSLFPSDGNA